MASSALVDILAQAEAVQQKLRAALAGTSPVPPPSSVSRAPPELVARADAVQQQLSAAAAALVAPSPVPPPSFVLPPPEIFKQGKTTAQQRLCAALAAPSSDSPAVPPSLHPPISKSISSDLAIDGYSTPPISRSNSSTSWSSGHSGWSMIASQNRRFEELDDDEPPFSDDDNKSDDDLVPKKKKRRKTPTDVALARSIVREPVLRALDKKYLRPLNSKLFRRMFKRQKNVDGTRSLKKNPDIQAKLFKRLVRPILRQILGNDRMQDREVVQRYYDAALFVAKRRRANHVQSWRLKSRPKHLRFQSCDTFCDDKPLYREDKKKPDQEAKKTSLALQFDSASSSEETPDEDESQVPEASQAPDLTAANLLEASLPAGAMTPSLHHALYHPDKKAKKQTAANLLEASLPAGAMTPSLHHALYHPDKKAKKHTAWPPCGFEKVVTKCTECGEKVEYNSPFSQNQKGIKCPDCFAKFIAKEYVPLVHDDRKSGQERREDALAERDALGKKVRKKRTTCKHCGSTSHLTRNSKKCPKNPKYQGEDFFDVGPVRGIGGYYHPPTPPPLLTTTGDGSAAQQQPGAQQQPPAQQQLPPQQQQQSPAEQQQQQSPAEQEPTTPPEPVPQRFNVNDNVIAKWTRNARYLAHVCGYCAETREYTVYFLDGKVKSGLKDKDLRNAPKTHLRRSDMIGVDFFYDGLNNRGVKDMSEGRFKVRRILGDENQFVCVRVTGGEVREHGQVVNFDVGYVMGTHEEEGQLDRERGPVYSAKRGR